MASGIFSNELGERALAVVKNDTDNGWFAMKIIDFLLLWEFITTILALSKKMKYYFFKIYLNVILERVIEAAYEFNTSMPKFVENGIHPIVLYSVRRVISIILHLHRDIYNFKCELELSILL